MEKKNMIFLSVIAVATLLTAVVGATFAYFSATSGNGQQVVSGAAKQIAGISTEIGGVINFEGAMPGWLGVGYIKVTTPSEDDTATGKFAASIDPNGLNAAFNDWIKYKVYKTSEVSFTPITVAPCTTNEFINGSTTEYTMDCVLNLGSFTTEATDAGTEFELVAEGNLNELTGKTELDEISFVVETYVPVTYYVVYEFEKPDGVNQNTVQGMSINPIFSVETKS